MGGYHLKAGSPILVSSDLMYASEGEQAVSEKQSETAGPTGLPNAVDSDQWERSFRCDGDSFLYPTLSYPTLPYPTLSYPIAPNPILTYRTSPYPTLPYPSSTCPNLTCPTLDGFVKVKGWCRVCSPTCLCYRARCR